MKFVNASWLWRAKRLPEHGQAHKPPKPTDHRAAIWKVLRSWSRSAYPPLRLLSPRLSPCRSAGCPDLTPHPLATTGLALAREPQTRYAVSRR